jgi:beta-phosphoglucomutase-like phosphatase (HAD superfamily)
MDQGIMSEFDLGVFDCDGVLVDSERITNSVFAQMLNELGVPVTLDNMFERFVGHSMPQCLDMLQNCWACDRRLTSSKPIVLGLDWHWSLSLRLYLTY